MIVSLVSLPYRYDKGMEIDTTRTYFTRLDGMDEFFFEGDITECAAKNKLFKYKLVESVHGDIIEKLCIGFEPITTNDINNHKSKKVMYPIIVKHYNDKIGAINCYKLDDNCKYIRSILNDDILHYHDSDICHSKYHNTINLFLQELIHECDTYNDRSNINDILLFMNENQEFLNDTISVIEDGQLSIIDELEQFETTCPLRYDMGIRFYQNNLKRFFANKHRMSQIIGPSTINMNYIRHKLHAQCNVDFRIKDVPILPVYQNYKDIDIYCVLQIIKTITKSPFSRITIDFNTDNNSKDQHVETKYLNIYSVQKRYKEWFMSQINTSLMVFLEQECIARKIDVKKVYFEKTDEEELFIQIITTDHEKILYYFDMMLFQI